MSKKQKFEQPINVMSDEVLGTGFKPVKPPELVVVTREERLSSSHPPRNDVNRTVREALEHIIVSRREVRAVIVLATGETSTEARLFTTSKTNNDTFLLGTLITVTEQSEFGESSPLHFDIDPLIGQHAIGDDDKSRINQYLQKKKNAVSAIEVIVVYKDAVTVCGHLPRYIHYDFA